MRYNQDTYKLVALQTFAPKFQISLQVDPRELDRSESTAESVSRAWVGSASSVVNPNLSILNACTSARDKENITK